MYRALIVEDEDLMRDYLAANLTNFCPEWETACDLWHRRSNTVFPCNPAGYSADRSDRNVLRNTHSARYPALP